MRHHVRRLPRMDPITNNSRRPSSQHHRLPRHASSPSHGPQRPPLSKSNPSLPDPIKIPLPRLPPAPPLTPPNAPMARPTTSILRAPQHNRIRTPENATRSLHHNPKGRGNRNRKGNQL